MMMELKFHQQVNRVLFHCLQHFRVQNNKGITEWGGLNLKFVIGEIEGWFFWSTDSLILITICCFVVYVNIIILFV